MTSPEVIQQCRSGDINAQCQIYQSLSGMMFGVCLRYADSREEAEDMLHDGFLRLFEKIGDYRGDGSFEGWARRIFVTIALSRIRRKKKYLLESRMEYVAEVSDRHSTETISAMEAKEIMSCIGQLPVRYRTILNLYSIEGYSHQEIAIKLNISVESSRVGLLRAKSGLKKLLIQGGFLNGTR